MIFAPANSCMMIDPVTNGPMPRCMSEPCWPARIARREEKKSTTFARSSPYSQMFVREKYRRRMTMTHISFVRKWTCPSGRRTEGMRSVMGFSLYSRLCFSSAISFRRFRHRDRAPRGLHLRLRRLRRRRDRDPERLRDASAAEELREPRFPEVDLVRASRLLGEPLRHEALQAPLDILDVDTQGFARPVVVADEPVGAEVVRIVDEHPLELVLVEPRVPRAAAVPVAAPVLLPAPLPPGAPHLPRPADHHRPSGPSIRVISALMSFPRYPSAPPSW